MERTAERRRCSHRAEGPDRRRSMSPKTWRKPCCTLAVTVCTHIMSTKRSASAASLGMSSARRILGRTGSTDPFFTSPPSATAFTVDIPFRPDDDDDDDEDDEDAARFPFPPPNPARTSCTRRDSSDVLSPPR